MNVFSYPAGGRVSLVLPLVAVLLATSAGGGMQVVEAQPLPAVIPSRGVLDFDLSVANIMRGDLLVGRSPSEVRWSEDSRHVYFRWREPESGDTTTHIYRVSVAGGAPELVRTSQGRTAGPAQQGTWSADRRFRAFVRDGDVFVRGVDGSERQVTHTPVPERLPQLSPDGRVVYYVQGTNVFGVDRATGTIRQLTDIRTTARPDSSARVGQARRLEEQQAELLGAVRDQALERLHRAAVDSVRRGVPTIYLGRNTTLVSAQVSPSGRHLLIGVGEEAEERRTLVPNFVTESGYTENLTVRSKVGDAQTGQRAAMLDLERGELRWLSVGPEGRRMSVVAMGWAPRTDRALLMGLPLDHKDRWIYTVEPGAEPVTIDHLRDDFHLMEMNQSKLLYYLKK